MTQIFVVSSDAVGLANTLGVLSDAGYHANGASTFQEATKLLAGGSPDLVIADQRLGAFNGLHVILRARAEHPDVSAIVTVPVKDRGLEADAKSLGVECMLKPQNPREWLGSIARVLNRDRIASSSTILCEGVHALD